MSRPTVGSRYIPTLDGWRALAIVAVVASHTQEMLAHRGWGNPSLLVPLSWGRLGVDLFFAMSGFLICSRLLDEREETGRISLRDFYLRRAFRILPLYFAYLLIVSLLGLFAGLPLSWQEVASCVLFFRNYAIPPEGGYTNHFWSLAVEEHFYIFWPLWLALIGPKAALRVTPVLALGVHVWRSLDARYALFASVFADAGWLHRTDTRIDNLLWGCFAALLLRARPTLTLPAWTPWAGLILIVVLVASAAPMMPLFLALIFPVLILGTVTQPRSLMSRFLERPFMRRIGQLSYSLYVWQTLFLQSSTSPDPAWLTFLKRPPINFLMIVACAAVCHYGMEQPFIRLGRKFVAKLQGKPPASSSGPRMEQAPSGG